MANPYCIVDVFTNMALSGNPLAVVFDADNLSPLLMQQITREFNLSETVFICSPKSKKNTARLRIFTPIDELPFAGHPTVGAAIALGIRDGSSAVRLEEKIGIVTAIIELGGKNAGFARFSLPQLAVEINNPPADLVIANALNIQPNAIGFGNFFTTRYSAGNEFVCVPVRDKKILKKIRPDAGNWAKYFGDSCDNVFVYTQLNGDANAHYSARMFSPSHGVIEDPATGSAVAAFSGVLEQFSDLAEGHHCIKVLQGIDMGRPSEIELALQIEEAKIAGASIGGDAVIIARGELDVGA